MENLKDKVQEAQDKVKQFGSKLSLAQEHKAEIQHFYSVDISLVIQDLKDSYMEALMEYNVYSEQLKSNEL